MFKKYIVRSKEKYAYLANVHDTWGGVIVQKKQKTYSRKREDTNQSFQFLFPDKTKQPQTRKLEN